MTARQTYTELTIKEDGQKEGHFSFRRLDFDKDVNMLYEWMHQKHIAPFWKLDLPMEDFKEWVRKSVEAEHKDCFIGTYEGKPVCYVIAYRIKEDPIKDYYDHQSGDLGMHLLIGDRSYLNKEDGVRIVRAMILFLFDHYGAKRIVGEPDIRNRIVIPVLKRLGGDVEGRVQLPGKRAALITGEQSKVMKTLQEDGIHTIFHSRLSPVTKGIV
ncbi:GNAT family N-acetyltransferase [Salimicrobium sp. PL1-032A]|uniref:GNAT family N-acetyltransferase n=1 Tax=Salimicrobium sp. PL1-032A TaxID=3095364 RepID=UPI0032617B30